MFSKSSPATIRLCPIVPEPFTFLTKAASTLRNGLPAATLPRTCRRSRSILS